MPKVVDHEARRQQVACALWQVVRGHGLDGTTIRRVAEVAGVSIGLVQHYFSSKLEMERFALDSMIAASQDRMSRRIEVLGPQTSARSLLHVVLVDLTLPVDEQRRAEYQVTLAFAMRSLQWPDFAQMMRSDDEDLLTFVAEVLRSAWLTGELAPERDPDDEAAMLLCFADGCGQRILLGHLDPAVGARALDRVLDRLFDTSTEQAASAHHDSTSIPGEGRP